MYKVWRLGSLVLGIATVKQFALGGGVKWIIRPYGTHYRHIYVWFNIGPLHMWFVWEKVSSKN